MTTTRPRATPNASPHAPDPTTTRVRDDLIARIQAQIAAGGWTQQKVAELCSLTQPRISNLLRGNTSRFSLDALVDISAALARHVPTLTDTAAMTSVDAAGQHLAARHVKGRYPAATESSTTERGGTIVATSGFFTIGGRVALVGDIARYPDGSTARIICGAGAAALYDGRPLALTGSELDNGDHVIGPAHNGMVIVHYADEEPIEGLFDPLYSPNSD